MRPPSVVLLARAAWLLNEHTIRHDPHTAESVLAMLERCIDTPHTPETRQSILTTLFGPASQFLCDGQIQAQDLLSWISQRTSSGLTSEEQWQTGHVSCHQPRHRSLP